MTVALSVEQVILLHERFVAAGPLRDRGLLEGAVQAPYQIVFDHELYPTVALKATKLADGISRAQAFLDGNKRLAWLSTTTFLQLNGLIVCAPQDEAAQWVLELDGGPAGLRDAASWLNDRLDNLT